MTRRELREFSRGIHCVIRLNTIKLSRIMEEFGKKSEGRIRKKTQEK